MKLTLGLVLASIQSADLAGLGGLRLVHGILHYTLILLGLNHWCRLLDLLLGIANSLVLSLGLGSGGRSGALSGLRFSSGSFCLLNGLRFSLVGICGLLIGLSITKKMKERR